MLAPAFDVLREFLYALVDLLLALPRHFWAFTQRTRRLAEFEQLQSAPIPPTPSTTPPAFALRHLVVSCGDASGQAHALRLCRLLQQRHPNLRLSGFGGCQLEDLGMEVWRPLADLNVMGFRDVAAQLPLFFSAVFLFAKEMRQHPPDAVLLVDYPGLNRHLLRIAKRCHVPVVDFIAPQLWAWAPWRIRDFRRADLLLTILPFEENWYCQHGAQAKYIGHPLAEQIAAAEDPCPWQPPDQQGPWVALLPGSRKREIKENLPLMLAAASLLQQQKPELRFVLPHLRQELWPLLQPILQESTVEVTPAVGAFHSVLSHCIGAWVVSGTASLEVAARGVPAVVVYQMSSRLGSWLASHALSVPHVAGANLILGRRQMPELLGHHLQPQALCTALLQQMQDAAQARSAAEELHTHAFAPGTTLRAALAIESTIISEPSP